MAEVDLPPAVILSKLHPPRLTGQHVPRQRLVDFLNQHSDRPLTLVSAASGFGKSTLLSEWLATSPRLSAWVSLDQHDNDLAVFVEYILAAVRTPFPTLSCKTEDLLDSLISVPLEVLAATLSNDLAQIATEFFLVLDDYHVITNPQIHELLSRLLSHPPHSLHLVIATRAEPALPLMTLRSHGQMSELGSEHLRFTRQETAAFVRNEFGDDVADDRIAALHEESEGWAVGLQLLTLMPDFSGSSHRASPEGETNYAIARYLSEEVFALQPTCIRQNLLRLSILRQFSAGLCEALCDREAAKANPGVWGRDFIAHLEHANLFVSPVGGHPEFFRFDHLFREYLAERARDELSPTQIAGLHRRASELFAANGSLDEAVHHALAAGEDERAADLVAVHREDVYNQERFAYLAQLLRALPKGVGEHNPELLLARACLAFVVWRHSEAAALVSEAERALADAPLPPDRRQRALAEVAVYRARLALWTGDQQELETETRVALDLLHPDSSHLVGLTQVGLAASSYLRGDAAKAVAYLEEQLAHPPFDTAAHTSLLHALGFLHWLTGDLTRLHRTQTQQLLFSAELALPEQAAVAHYFLGVVHYFRNELDQAEPHLVEAVDARFSMRPLWWCQAAGLLALIYETTDRPQQARRTLEDATTFLQENYVMRLLPSIGAFQAELDRRQGRLAEAIAWTRHVELSPLVWPLDALEPRLEQVLILISQEGETGRDEAAGILAELRDLCRRIPNRRLQLQINAFDALLLEEQGRHEAALQALERTVIAAEPEGWIRLFVDLGEPMALLLTELSRLQVAPYAVDRILAAFSARHVAGSPDQSRLANPLTERELEVLDLLVERMSNKEIASCLYIAPSTVKRHTLNIYRKLGVNSRREAVLAAHEVGLLPSNAPGGLA